MSHKATNWAIQQRGLKALTKIVLWHLSDCHNPTAGCFPTQAYLAKEAECSRATINRQLYDLEARGLITREKRVDKATGKQVSTRYLLAFEEDFEPLDVVARVSNCDTENRVSETGQTVSQSCETQTFKLTGKTPLSPSRRNTDFYQIWEAWPESRRGKQQSALDVWHKLFAPQQQIALETLKTALWFFNTQRPKRSLPRLSAYLTAKGFEVFHKCPELKFDARFEITPEREEWAPWMEAMRVEHGADADDYFRKMGFILTVTRWPEPAKKTPPEPEKTA